MPPAIVNEDAHALAQTLALRALAWTVTDEDRASRLLAITGIEPGDLRARAGEPAVLAATLQFLTAHEADLVACADDLGVLPQTLADAAARLEGA